MKKNKKKKKKKLVKRAYKKKYFKKSHKKRTTKKKYFRKNTSRRERSKKQKKKRKKINRLFAKIRKKSKSRIDKRLKLSVINFIRFKEKISFKFNFNIDQYLQNFFQGISNKINSKIEDIKFIVEEERIKKKEASLKKMQKEKLENEKKIKQIKKQELEAKQKELKDEIKLVKERKKELQKFIRQEQAVVRREQADKQRKFLEQIRLEKKIEQFRKREALEIKNLEKFVLSQERDSYAGVEQRIESIKQKYQALRDQKIRERIEELGIQVTDSDTRAELLEKERQHNADRQKIEFALESYYRSMASCVFQLNKKWIPKKMSLLRVLDYRYERSEILIKFDEDDDEKWLMLVYIKDNNPDSGIIVEDKTNPEKNISIEYKTNEIFKFSDALVDSLTNLLDRERNKRKSNQ